MGARKLRVLARVIAAAGLLVALLPSGIDAAGVTFGTPTATSAFGQGLAFTQPIDLGIPVDRVEILLTFPGSSGSDVVEVNPPATTGTTTLRYTLGTSAGDMTPNTPVTARWRVRPTGAHDPLPAGPAVTVTYADTRFTWQTATSGLVRVHWYQGDASFGRRALAIAADAITTAEKALGVDETSPIDCFMYADRSAFRDAIGTSLGEFTVGRALPETRTFFGLILQGDLSGSETAITIAHELTHIVFDTASHNPYHEPPSWLNEGVAKYLSEGYGSADRALVSNGVKDGTLYPLTGLVPPALPGEKTFLAYAEADAAVDYLVRTYGQPALARLVDSYATGRTDDEAFTQAIGKDLAAFQADWFASIGAKVPPAAGPSAAPAGPLPPGWGGGSVASPGPGATAAATTGGSVAPGAPGDGTATTVGLLVVGLVVLAVVLVAIRARRRHPVQAAPAWTSGPAGSPPLPVEASVMPPEATPPAPAWPSAPPTTSSPAPAAPTVPIWPDGTPASWPDHSSRPDDAAGPDSRPPMP